MFHRLLFCRTWSAAGCLPALLATGLPLVVGCGGRFRDIQPVQSRPAADQHFNIEPYLQATRLGQWTYMRVEPGHHGGAGVGYPRVSGPDRMVEGELASREFLPIEEYLDLQASASQPVDAGRVRAPLKGGAGFFFELVEPVELFPRDMVPGTPITSSTPVEYFGKDGRRIAEGSLTRIVQIEGFDEVDCPAGRFADCLRIRLDFTLEIPWFLHLDWSTFIWLSADAGEVRRFQEMSGWFLVFWFSSSHEYQLVSGGPCSAAEPLPRPLWRYGAVLLDRALPRPQIAGMVVDYGEAPVTAPGDLTEDRENVSVDHTVH